MKTSVLLELENYFEKNNLAISRKINKIIVTASPQQIPSDPNKAIEDFARKQNALKKISDSEINFGSVIQVSGAGDAVYKLSKEDVLRGGEWYMCLKEDPNINIPDTNMIYNLQKFADEDESLVGSGQQRVNNFLSRYREYSGLGGQSRVATFFLSGHTPYQTDEFYTKHSKMLVLLRKDTNVIQIEKFDVDSPSLADFVDIVTDLIVIGASLLALVATGPVGVGLTFLKVLRNISNAAIIIGILNNLLDGNYLEAILGIIALLIGNPKADKSLLRAYMYYFRGPNAIYITRPGVLLHVPPYVLSIGSALMETIQYAIEAGIGAFRDYQEEVKEKYGIDKQTVTEQELLAAKQKARGLEKYILEVDIDKLDKAMQIAKSDIVVNTGA